MVIGEKWTRLATNRREVDLLLLTVFHINHTHFACNYNPYLLSVILLVPWLLSLVYHSLVKHRVTETPTYTQLTIDNPDLPLNRSGLFVIRFSANAAQGICLQAWQWYIE